MEKGAVESHVAVEECGSGPSWSLSVLSTHFHPQVRLVTPEGYGEGLSPCSQLPREAAPAQPPSACWGGHTKALEGCTVTR